MKWLLLLFLVVPSVATDRTDVQLLDRYTNDNGIEINRFHDNQSGIEFLCARSTVSYWNNLSCFPTGRKW